MSWMLAKSPRLGKEFCYTGVGTPTVKRCYHPVILFFSFFLDRIVRSSSHFYIEKHSSMFSATASANLSCLSPLTAAVEFILLVYLPASKMVRFSSSVSHTHTKLYKNLLPRPYSSDKVFFWSWIMYESKMTSNTCNTISTRHLLYLHTHPHTGILQEAVGSRWSFYASLCYLTNCPLSCHITNHCTSPSIKAKGIWLGHIFQSS